MMISYKIIAFGCLAGITQATNGYEKIELPESAVRVPGPPQLTGITRIYNDHKTTEGRVDVGELGELWPRGISGKAQAVGIVLWQAVKNIFFGPWYLISTIAGRHEVQVDYKEAGMFGKTRERFYETGTLTDRVLNRPLANPDDRDLGGQGQFMTTKDIGYAAAGVLAMIVWYATMAFAIRYCYQWYTGTLPKKEEKEPTKIAKDITKRKVTKPVKAPSTPMWHYYLLAAALIFGLLLGCCCCRSDAPEDKAEVQPLEAIVVQRHTPAGSVASAPAVPAASAAPAAVPAAPVAVPAVSAGRAAVSAVPAVVLTPSPA